VKNAERNDETIQIALRQGSAPVPFTYRDYAPHSGVRSTPTSPIPHFLDDSYMKPSLCVDIDNVVAQTDIAIRRIISEVTNKRVQLKYEDIVNFDYWQCQDASGASITKEEWHTVHAKFSEPESLLSLQPMDGAVEQLSALGEHADIYFVTSRLQETSDVTVAWLKLHGFRYETVHTVPHRQKQLLHYKFAAVIEDDYDQAMLFDANVLLLTHPWNKDRRALQHISWHRHWSLLAQQIRKTLGIG
jgi:5'(3')-deoxyribonucleotidase